MRLRMNFGVSMSVRYVGRLALIGKSKKSGKNGDSTVVTFLLDFVENAPLAEYFNPQGGFRPGSLLYQIFVGEGFQVMEAVGGEGYQKGRLLVFTREVAGDVRSERKFLNATGKTLLRDLQAIEDAELSMQELSDQMEWGEHQMLHPGVRGPMPDFTRPRHE